MNMKIKSFVVTIIIISLVISTVSGAYLPNYGNENASQSCFLNASVQALFHTKPLRDYLDNNGSAYPDGSVSQLFIKHIHEMQATTKTKTTCSPATFRAAITADGSPIHSMQYGQHDARQLLLFLILKLREDLPKPAIDDQEILKLIYHTEAPDNGIGKLLESLTTSLTVLKLKLGALSGVLQNKDNKDNKELTPEAIITSWIISTLWTPIKKSSKRFPATQEALQKNLISNLETGYATDLGLQRSKACAEKNTSLFNSSSDALIGLALATHNKRIEGIHVIVRKLFNALGAEKFYTLCHTVFTIKKQPGAFVGKQDAVETALKNAGCDTKDLETTIKKLGYNEEKEYLYVLYGQLSSFLEPLKEPVGITKKLYDALQENIENADWSSIMGKINAAESKKDALFNMFCFYTRYKTSSKSEGEWFLPLAHPDQKMPIKLEHLVSDFFLDPSTNKPQDLVPPVPQILIVQLKRGTGTTAPKFLTPITVPINNLDLRTYLPAGLTVTPAPMYNLYAIVVHQGVTFKYGHYWAYAKSYTNNTWYYYDDCGDRARVCKPGELEALVNPTGPSSDTPYILFYHRADIDYGALP